MREPCHESDPRCLQTNAVAKSCHFSLGWYFQTYMPGKGMEERGVADSQLHMLHKDLLLNKDFVSLVESAKKPGSPSDLEKGNTSTQQGNNQATDNTANINTTDNIVFILSYI